MSKLIARLYLWFLGFNLKVIFSFILFVIICLCLFGYLANAQTITKYYEGSHKVRIDGSTSFLNALTFFK